ncbi:MAG: glycosyltransferase [Desulfomonilaceae bacterium]
MSTKFAFVSHVLPPSWSGQAVMIERVLRGIDPERYCLISKDNYENSLSAANYINKLPSQYHHLPPEFEIRLLRSSGKIMWANTLLGVLQRGARIAQIVRREQCCAVVAATGDLIDLPAAYMASRLAGVVFLPYLFDDYLHQWPDTTRRNIARFVESVIFKRSAGIFVPNEFLQQEVMHRHGVSSTIVRNPYRKLDINIGRKYAPINNGEITIVYTGAIYQVNFQAFRNLINAMDRLNGPSVRLHLYTAQAPEWLVSQQICGEKVSCHSHLPDVEIVGIQRDAHILFLPFSFESTTPEVVRASAPGKLGDYLSSGTPILANVPGDSYVSWYLKKYNCGLVVDQPDPSLLVNAIQRIIEDENLRSSLAQNAQDRARIDFCPRQATRSFLDVVNRCS